MYITIRKLKIPYSAAPSMGAGLKIDIHSIK